MWSKSFQQCIALGLTLLLSASAWSWSQSDGPKASQTHALELELRKLMAVQARGGWPRVESPETLELGMVNDGVEALRTRLTLSGDLPDTYGFVPASFEAKTFDYELLQAVIRFQTRHGLEPDGAVGPATLRALNMPISNRIEQLKLNLERWAAFTAPSEGDLILVNIPEYTLRLYENNRLNLDMRVVVGKKRRATPEMVEVLEYLVVNPYWYVPQRISRQEILPKVQEDTSYLSRMNYEVWQDGARVEPTSIAWEELTEDAFDYSFRQQPGSNNSLGQVKFMMPNSKNIYLHDTPSKALFDRTRRTFSHGCVRLEEPFRLAKAVLQMSTALSDAEIDERLAKDYTSRIELERHLPVHLTYFTAWAHEGVVHYLPDVYRRDGQAPQRAPAPPVRTMTASVDTATTNATQDLVWSSVPATTR